MKIILKDLESGKIITKVVRNIEHFQIQLKTKRSYYPGKFSRKIKHKKELL